SGAGLVAQTEEAELPAYDLGPAQVLGEGVERVVALVAFLVRVAAPQVPTEVVLLDDVVQPALQGLGRVQQRVAVLLQDPFGLGHLGLDPGLLLELVSLLVDAGGEHARRDRADQRETGGTETEDGVEGELHSDTVAASGQSSQCRLDLAPQVRARNDGPGRLDDGGEEAVRPGFAGVRSERGDGEAPRR